MAKRPLAGVWEESSPNISNNVAGRLLGDREKEAIAALLARLEKIGVCGAVVVEVPGNEEVAEDFRAFILARTGSLRRRALSEGERRLPLVP